MSLLQSEPAEKLFVWLWSSAKPFHAAETPKHTHVHPERVRSTVSQDCAASGADLVQWKGRGGHSNYILF